MSTAATSRGDLIDARNVLIKRRANTADPAERAVIDETLEELSGLIQDLNQADLLSAASIVAQASDALETVVASARLGPFDSYLVDIQAVMDRLQHAQSQMGAPERLAPARGVAVNGAAPAAAAGAAPSAASSSPGPEPAAGTTPPARATRAARTGRAPKPLEVEGDFAALRDEYAANFERCVPRHEFKGGVEFCVSRLLKFRVVYEDLGKEEDIRVPWFFIGILHAMECSFDFTTHLHNGDPLKKKTVKVPRNRPASGTPPFTWRESARDALALKGFTGERDWTVPHMLFFFEKYNGFGYRPLGVPSPYLWSFSNLYDKGKFVADHQFDPDAVSRQCGTAVMLKGLQLGGVSLSV